MTTAEVPRDLRRQFVIGLLAAVGYYASARLGYTFELNPQSLVIEWMPAGFLLALLVLLPQGEWVAALAGSALGNVVADLSHGATPLNAVFAAAANGLESLAGAWFMVRFCGPRVTLGRLREVLVLVLGVVVATNAVTSVVGALSGGSGVGPRFWRAWFMWWAGDGLGMLIVAPAIITSVDRFGGGRRMRARHLFEALVVFAVIATVTHALFAERAAFGGLLREQKYLAFPLLLYAAIRFGPWGAAMGTLVVGCVTAFNAAHPLAGLTQVGQSPTAAVITIYAYLALASVSSLVPGAMLRERGIAEKKARESEARFQELAEHIQEAFFHIDVVSGRPTYVSPTWSTIWARPLQDAYDLNNWARSIDGSAGDALLEAQDACKRGQPSDVVYQITRPDGTARWVRQRMFLDLDDDARAVKIIGVATDITDLRDAEARFTQVQKMEAVGRLAGGVAHDFNNLLTVILGCTDELLASPGATRDTIECATEIAKAGDSATVLTRQLLAFSRRQLVEPTVFALNDAVEDTVKMLRRLIGEDITLETSLAPRAGFVRMDRGQLEQLLTNLAVNARHAMPDGGTLTITTAPATLDAAFVRANPGARSGENVQLAIADSGTGMTAEVVAHAFEPFFTTKAHGQGTGLGLATCYGIVKQAGGYIGVDTRLGKGTTFNVYLPQISQDEVAAESSAAPRLPRGTETILLVEDETTVREVALRMLTGLGYTVISESDPRIAYERLCAPQPPVHLLFTDIVMPGLNGRELAELAVKVRPGLRTLFSTGYTDDAVLQAQLEARTASVIHKPYSRRSLALKLREVLDREEV